MSTSQCHADQLRSTNNKVYDLLPGQVLGFLPQHYTSQSLCTAMKLWDHETPRAKQEYSLFHLQLLGLDIMLTKTN